jgi:hypothetical protein
MIQIVTVIERQAHLVDYSLGNGGKDIFASLQKYIGKKY